MLFKAIGKIIIMLCGIAASVAAVLREQRKLRLLDGYLSLMGYAVEQIEVHGSSVPELLSRAAPELQLRCGLSGVSDGETLLAQAEEQLIPEGYDALVGFFRDTAVTREQQLARGKACVRVLRELQKKQAESLPGKLRSGAVLPVCVAAMAVLLLW